MMMMMMMMMMKRLAIEIALYPSVYNVSSGTLNPTIPIPIHIPTPVRL